MKSFRSMMRRLSIVAGATVVGTTALVALTTTPAHATDADIVGTAVCDTTTGNWVVSWTVSSVWTPTGTLQAVTWGPTGSTTSGAIVVNATLVRNSPLLGTQTVPGTTTARSASLRVTTYFTNRHTSHDRGQAEFEGTCEQDEPKISAEPKSTCDEFAIKVTNTGTVPASGTVTPNGGAPQSFNLAPGADQTFTFPGGAGVSAVVTLGQKSETFEWDDPGDCPTATTPPPATTTTTTPPLPVTGASLTSLIGIGGALVLVGGVLLMVLRRRRSLGES